MAIQSGNLECVELLIMQNVNVIIKLPDNTNILHFAVKYFPKTEKIIHCICNKGILSPYQLCVLINSYNDDGMTPLEMASREGLIECVKAMIGARPNLLLRNKGGSTATHMAARYGYVDTLEQLIKYDQRCLEVTNVRGWKPLHVAARSGNGNCVILMLRYGADVAACVTIDNTNKSALDLIVDYVPMAKEKLINLFDSYVVSTNYDKSEDDHSIVEIDYALLLGTVSTNRNTLKESVQSQHDASLLMDEKGRQTIFVKTLLNCKNENLKETLLLHPLVETYLFYKWENLKFFFIILFLCYSIYTVVLILFATLNYLAEVTTINFLLRPIIFILLLPLGLTVKSFDIINISFKYPTK